MVPFSFAGRAVVPLPDGALFWPARRALLIADLHLEKASFFARSGQMLPPYDSLATLAALESRVRSLDAREVWCLGDSFHDVEGCARLPAAARSLLEQLTRQQRWTWIIGNHDPRIIDRCGGDVAAEAEVDGIVLRHNAAQDDARPEVSGHFHPKLRLTLRGRRIARRCFVSAPSKLILPAFGVLTGGMDAGDPAVLAAVGRPAAALVPVENRLLRFPLAA
jgi:DNA ligase-associated metallophosphoesterase